MKNLTLIGITGRKRSGKDTIGKYLIEKYGFVRLAFADPLKKACQEIFGFSDEQVFGDDLKEVIDPYWNHSPREILQKVGTELFRERLSEICEHIDKDIWIRSIERSIQNLVEKGNNKIVITDVRFPNELEFFKKYNGITYKVIRPSIMDQDSSNLHTSEAMIDDIETDYEFINDGTIQDLYSKIDQIY